MDLAALFTLTMSAVAHTADYVSVALAGHSPAPGVGTPAAGKKDDENASFGERSVSNSRPTKQALRRNRFIAVVVAAVVVVLVYFEVHEAAKDLWTVIANAPRGSFSSPSKLVQLCSDVQKAAAGQLAPVTLLLSVMYLTLQTFCIPGTIALNAVIGALLGLEIGLPLCVALGTLGATCCYGLSSLAGARLAAAVDQRLMQGQGIPKLRSQVSRFRAELFAYLLFLRLTPILPNWLINLASPVVNVPLKYFAGATLVGITPQTYLSVRFGTIAQSGSVASIVTWYDTAAIAMLGVVVLGVMRLKKKFVPPTASPPE